MSYQIPKELELPKTISTSLTSKKPSAKLRQLKIDDNFVLRYEGIKTGGIEFEAKGKTLKEATTDMWKQLKRYDLLPLQPSPQTTKTTKASRESQNTKGVRAIS